MVGKGTAQVRIEALGTANRSDTKYGKVRSYTPVNYYRGDFSIQVGAFQDRENADKLAARLDRRYKNAHVVPHHNRRKGTLLHRVLVGKCTTLEQAEQYMSYLKQKGYKDAFVVAD